MAGTFGRRGIVGEAPVAAQRGFAPAQSVSQLTPSRGDTGGQRFDYKPKIATSLLGVGFFTMLAMFATHMALTNDRGLILYHLIHFDRDGATVFYWIVAAVLIVATCCAAYGVSLAFGNPREIVVGKATITAPAGALSSQTVTVRYGAITRVEVTQQGKNYFFKIHHKDGKLSIPKSMIADDDTFEALLAAVSARIAEIPGWQPQD